MANNKTGFVYYNVDTDRYLDIKIKKVKRSFGATGIAIYDYVLAWIYREKGCFLIWDESTVLDVAEYWNVKETLVTEIIAYCANVGLFDKELLSNGKILSGKSIVSRYQEMNVRAKRKNFKLPEFLVKLLEECVKLPEESTKLPEVSDKVNKVKKEEKEEESSPPVFLSEEEILNAKAAQMLIPEMLQVWKSKKPNYYSHKEVDYPALLIIAKGIAKFKNWKQASIVEEKKDELLKSWDSITDFILCDEWLKQKDLTYFSIEKNWVSLVNKMIQKNSLNVNGKSKQQQDEERQKARQRNSAVLGD